MELDAYFDALAVIPNMRTATFDDLEMTRKNEGFRFVGHAGVYDEEALIDDIPGVGEIRETVRRPAFEPILRTVEQENVNIPFTIEHDEAKVLATTRSKRLRLSADQKGLAVEAELPPTTLSRDLYANYQAGIVTGMSYGFVTGPRSSGNWTIERRSTGVLRSISGFKKLLDVTATWNPTFLSAEAQFRSQALRFADSADSMQQILRGAFALSGGGASAGEIGDASEFRAVMLDDDATQIARLRAMLQLAAAFIAEEDEQPDIDKMEGVQNDLNVLLQSELAEPDAGGSGATRSANTTRVRSVAARKRALSLYLTETGGIAP
jgi:HK97 family phage prohead protease